MSYKTIQQIIAPPPPSMVGDGFRVHRFFPGNGIGNKRMSPFFLMDYNARIDFSAKKEPRGVGVHPHRGFETVTIAYHGSVAHQDSAGHSGIIEQGEVQWMTAGSGILHKEHHEESYSQKGGPFQMVQLWVNLPAQYKMTPPKYQAITKDKIQKYTLPDDSGLVEVIAGTYNDVKGPASTFTPLEVYNIRLNPTGSASLQLPEMYHTGLLTVQGGITVNGKEVAQDHFVLFENAGTDISITAAEEAIVLVISGEPIDEPLAVYGPFVMNTHEELQQAFEDYNKGKFGYLE